MYPTFTRACFSPYRIYSSNLLPLDNNRKSSPSTIHTAHEIVLYSLFLQTNYPTLPDPFCPRIIFNRGLALNTQ